MPKIKTSVDNKKDSTIQDLISHISRVETSLDGISSTLKNKSTTNSNEKENVSDSNELGVALSKTNEYLEKREDLANQMLTRLTEIRDTLRKNVGTNEDKAKDLDKKFKASSLFNFGFGKSKKSDDENESDEQYGTIEKRDQKTKLLEKIAANTVKDKKEEKEEKKEEKGGLLSKILGFAGKLILPMLAGLLLSGLKPLVKNLISDLFGHEGILGDVGDFVGEAVADMLPGAAAGWLLTKSWRGALIGASISYGAARIKEIVDDIKGMMNGEPRQGYGELKGYEQKALAGALAGGSIVGWKKGWFKAAMLGAGVGIATEWLLNRAEEIRAMIQGDTVEMKTIPGTGITEAVAGGMIGGAVIGHTVGGWKGAIWGAAIGTIAGAIATVATDFNNRLQAAKDGEYQEPAEICGIPYPIFTGVIAGAAIGAKFGGPIGGVIGAAIGGIAGAIYNWGSNLFMRNKATDTVGKKAVDEKLKDNKIVQGANAQKDQLDSEIDAITKQEQELKAKLDSGEISQSEAMNKALALEAKKNQLRDKKGKVEDFRGDLERRMGHIEGVKKAGSDEWEISPMDTNGDGKITKDELNAWKKANGVTTNLLNPNSWGTQARTARRLENLLDKNKDGVTLDQLAEATGERHLDTQNLPTANQINTEKTNKEQLQVQKEQLEAQKENNENMEKLSDAIITATGQKPGEEDNDGAYSRTTASGSGILRRNT